jgi:UDP-N-acetylmuramate dehydrogenase
MVEEPLIAEGRIVPCRPLAPLTTLGIGGCAEYYFRAESVNDVIAACAWASERRLPVWVLSGGSNLVIADQGVRGLVIEIRLRGIEYHLDGGRVFVTAAAGENWDEFVTAVAERGLWGLECLSGIPGRVGATPIQNVGAYGQEVAQVITSIEAYDTTQHTVVSLPNQACDFGYRTSRFRFLDRGRFVILSVRFELQSEPRPLTSHAELRRVLDSDAATTTQTRQAVLALRRAKSMVFDEADPWSRSCGSFFVNPVVSAALAERIREKSGVPQAPIYPVAEGQAKIAAAWLIEQAGFTRAFRDGTVGLSNRHTLAIVAHADATARDVCRLARRIQQTVFERFEVALAPEPVFWGFDGFERGLPVTSAST